MNRILALSASNSGNSINRSLLRYAVGKIGAQSVSHLDIRDYPLPLYGLDLEAESGFPKNIEKLQEAISYPDGVIIACPEHNGSMPAVFKNAIDWLSRYVGPGQPFFGPDTMPILLLSASPGPGGGATNLSYLSTFLPYWGGQVRGAFSVGEFQSNFQDGTLTKTLEQELDRVLDAFVTSLGE